jgi:hypothetical protein
MASKNRFIFTLLILTIVSLSSCKNEDLSDMFVVKDTADIYKVVIEQGTYKLTIQRDEDGNRWMVNDRYPATEKSIGKLMQSFISMKIDKTVPSENIDSVIQALESKGRTISIFNKRNKPVKIFKTGEFKEIAGGTYMFESETRTPCIVNIPGLENNLNNRFSLQYIYWIEPLVFSYQPGEIKEITVDYKTDPQKSFRLTINGSKARLFQLSGNQEVSTLDYQKIGNYLSYFMNVKFADINLSGKNQADSLLKTEAHFLINVKDNKDHLKTVKFFSIPDINNPGETDINKMYALINDEDAVTVTYYDIDLILKDIKYFIK